MIGKGSRTALSLLNRKLLCREESQTVRYRIVHTQRQGSADIFHRQIDQRHRNLRLIAHSQEAGQIGLHHEIFARSG